MAEKILGASILKVVGTARRAVRVVVTTIAIRNKSLCSVKYFTVFVVANLENGIDMFGHN
jgi:hypothetical protein